MICSYNGYSRSQKIIMWIGHVQRCDWYGADDFALRFLNNFLHRRIVSHQVKNAYQFGTSSGNTKSHALIVPGGKYLLFYLWLFVPAYFSIPAKTGKLDKLLWASAVYKEVRGADSHLRCKTPLKYAISQSPDADPPPPFPAIKESGIRRLSACENQSYRHLLHAANRLLCTDPFGYRTKPACLMKTKECKFQVFTHAASAAAKTGSTIGITSYLIFR